MLWGWNAGAGIPEPLRKGLSHVDGCQGIATKPGRLVSVLLLRPQLGSAEKETELSLQMHFRSLPWRGKSANMTKNMHKINSLVRSGLATSFSLRGSTLLWEALIIFYWFTHSQKYDETGAECFFCLITVSIINYSPMSEFNHISYSKGDSFRLQGLGTQSLLGWWWISGLSHPPLPEHMGTSLLAPH